MKKKKIEEIIIVEGKDDVCAVKKAVEAEIIITHGFGLNPQIEQQIINASKRKALIILTDPDFAGEQIRLRVSKLVPGAKHAFIAREDAISDGDIGVENASAQTILKALEKARVQMKEQKEIFTLQDMIDNGLIGESFSVKLRNELGKALGIGYTNGKQFLKRLNAYGITREEFETTIEMLLSSQ